MQDSDTKTIQEEYRKAYFNSLAEMSPVEALAELKKMSHQIEQQAAILRVTQVEGVEEQQKALQALFSGSEKRRPKRKSHELTNPNKKAWSNANRPVDQKRLQIWLPKNVIKDIDNIKGEEESRKGWILDAIEKKLGFY